MFLKIIVCGIMHKSKYTLGAQPWNKNFQISALISVFVNINYTANMEALFYVHFNDVFLPHSITTAIPSFPQSADQQTSIISN